MPEGLKHLEEVQLPWGWWLDLGFRGGVAKRVGWYYKVSSTLKVHDWVVVFRDGTRGPVTFGHSVSIEEA